MKNNSIDQSTASQIISKAETTFGNRFGTTFSNVLGVPQPYVSKMKKFAQTGNEDDLPPRKSIEKFLTFLNSSNSVAPHNPVTPRKSVSNEHSLVLTVRNNQTNKFETGVTTSEEELRQAFSPTDNSSDSAKTDSEILNDIQTRFRMTEQSVSSIFRGGQSAVIISGPAGCGKSYTVEKKIDQEIIDKGPDFKNTHLKGANLTYTGLYKLLWEHKDGGVIIFDDSDKLWDDETMMNTLKAAMDTSKQRFISCASGGRWVRDLAEDAGVEEEEVRKFEFKGKIIFITNKDINGVIESGKKGSEHFAALVDRSFYIDLEMFSLRAKYLWCEYIFCDFIAPSLSLSDDLTLEIMEFVSDNRYNLRDVSVRGIEVIASVASDPIYKDSWKEFISITRFKRSK